MEFRTESLDCRNRIKSKTAFCIFVGSNWTVRFFPEEERHWLNSVISSNIWVGNIFSKNHIWREKHMIKKECMRLPILMPPRPVAINKATSITSVNATQARPYNISFMIVISYQWWYFRMPQGEIVEARRRYSSSLYSFHLLCFYRSFDYLSNRKRFPCLHSLI